MKDEVLLSPGSGDCHSLESKKGDNVLCGDVLCGDTSYAFGESNNEYISKVYGAGEGKHGEGKQAQNCTKKSCRLNNVTEGETVSDQLALCLVVPVHRQNAVHQCTPLRGSTKIQGQ